MRKMIFFSVLVLTIMSMSISCKEEQTEKITHSQKLPEPYQEKHRPQFHFTPEAKWMNDPNGMFFYKGKYHLFYQYYPDSTVWGPMHWGHAESKDLVHWKHLPIALYPDSLGLIFSGGAVVDLNNTSKFGTKENPPIVATFTHHNLEGEKAETNNFQTQSIAYSLDEGVKWTKYGHNPVIPNTEGIKDFRDPKVVWHEKSQQWILVLAAYDKVKFYASPNLIDWTHLSDFGIDGDIRLWECPDLFPIKVEGSDEEKWALIVSIQKNAPNGGTASSYFIGDFDGKTFTSDVKKQKWLDWGADNYAFVTWNNIPKDDGRIIGIGWMSNWQYAQIVPTENWRSAMTLPRELKLTRSNADYHLISSPVKELQALRKDSTLISPFQVEDRHLLEASFSPSQFEIAMEIDLKETTAGSFGFELKNDLGENLVITFDKGGDMLYVDRTNSAKTKFSEDFFGKKHYAPLNYDEDTMNIQLFVDASSLEIFVNGGKLNFTDIFFPSEKFNTVSLFSQKGTWKIKDTKIYSLKGIWKPGKK
ncbi:glycoside hydrolase family 32 protein [Zobellia uliginosa]|nr:glycoside hydrolase family 32 protein [Zobellia uliginosa]